MNKQDVITIFREWQNLSDQIDALKPQAWELSDDDAQLQDIAQQIKDLVLERIDLLTQPPARKKALEEFFQNSDIVSDPEIRECYRWFMHIAYLPRAEAEQFQFEAAKMEQKFTRFAKIEDEQGADASWDAQCLALEEMFALRRKMALPVAEVKKVKPSEVTLDYWNPYLRNADIDQAIADLGKLKPLLHRFFAGTLEAAQSAEHVNLPRLPESQTEQVRALFSDLRQAILDQAGWTVLRLEQEAVKLHPIVFGENGYCWGSPTDIRMGVEYCDGNLLYGLHNLLHETGHLLYLLSRNDAPASIKGTPAGHINGYSLHEAAAMTLEQAGKRRGFAASLEPLLRQYFPAIVLDERGAIRAEWSRKNILRAFTTQDHKGTEWCDSELALIPNMIWRVLAERYIMDATMSVSDLPSFWAKTMLEWTGKAHNPKDFSLSESHWLDDNAGYFWGYQFGAMMASLSHGIIGPLDQATPLRATFNAVSAVQKQQALLQTGAHFAPYIDFLTTHIFSKHCLQTPQAILDKVEPNASLRYASYYGYLRHVTGVEIGLGQNAKILKKDIISPSSTKK